MAEVPDRGRATGEDQPPESSGHDKVAMVTSQVRICAHMYAHVHTYTHTHTHRHAREHTHTHTHTHIYIYSFKTKFIEQKSIL